MEKAIKDFPKQFAFVPEIQNESGLKRRDTVIVAGMGGSHLAADILQAWNPLLDIVVRADYGLSGIPEHVLANSLVVVSSYSGNTEEPLAAFHEALQRNLPLAAISMGGELLRLANVHIVPHVQIPDTGIQPRSAVGFMFMALASLMGQDRALKEASALAQKLRAHEQEQQGKELSKVLAGKVPVIYASARNAAVAYNWKIKCNETAKIPAFFNVFPELNHNEMTGFDVAEQTRELSRNFAFLFLRDSKDHEKVQKRMDTTREMYGKKGLPVHVIPLEGAGRLESMVSSLILGDWTSYHLALQYGVNPDTVPMVEEFKKRIAQ